MKPETIYICPICNNGTLKDTGESIDSGECSACGESSYYSEAIASKKDVINLKEVAKTILEKNPYEVIKDSKTKAPATELSETINISKLGGFDFISEKFDNIPFYTYRNFRGGFKKTISLIGVDGEVIEVIEPSPFSSKYCDEHQKYLRDFKFSSNEDTIVFALKITYSAPGEEIENYLLFLSKPITIKTIQELRQSVYNKEDSEKISKDLNSIELIWK
jgi:rRNA maturation protein Nop10